MERLPCAVGITVGMVRAQIHDLDVQTPQPYSPIGTYCYVLIHFQVKLTAKCYLEWEVRLKNYR